MASKADIETRSADAKEVGNNSTKLEAHHRSKEQPLLVDLSASSNPDYTDNSSVSQHQEGEEREVFHPDGNLSLEDLMNSIEEEISMENARLSPPLLPPRENAVSTHSVTLPVVSNDEDNHDMAMDEDDTLDYMIMKEMMALNQETVAATDL